MRDHRSAQARQSSPRTDQRYSDESSHAPPGWTVRSSLRAIAHAGTIRLKSEADKAPESQWPGFGPAITTHAAAMGYGIFFTGLRSRPNSRAALAPRILRFAFSSRNGRS